MSVEFGVWSVELTPSALRASMGLYAPALLTAYAGT